MKRAPKGLIHAVPLIVVLGGLAALGARGATQASPPSGQPGTPTYPARGRCALIDYRDAVIDPIRDFATTADDSTLPTLVRVKIGSLNPNGGPKTLATYADTGPIFGLAFDGIRFRHYAGARPRSGSPLGDRPPGQIYEIDGATNPATVRRWVVLDAGPMEREVPPGPEYLHRIDRWGLGDLEVDDQAQWLFAVNLSDRRVYRLSLPDGAVIGSFPIGSSAEPWAPNARPFGLGWRDGWLYHGVVDSREDPALPGTLAAYVYRSRADGSDMVEVLSVALPSRWQPWGEPIDGAMGAQPILVDIEFRPNGDLILGLRNRAHDVQPVSTTSEQGEILATRREGERSVAIGGHYQASTRRWPKPIQGGLAAWYGQDSVFAAVLGAVYQPQEQPREQAGGLLLDNVSGRQAAVVPYSACWPCQPVVDSLGDVESTCRLFMTPTPSTTPTASRTPAPSATPSSSATSSPTTTRTSPPPTPTAPPSPPPTIVPRPVFLPILLQQQCADLLPVDLALVLDMSTSMNRPGPGGVPKYIAATEAAGVLVAALTLHSLPSSDRVAVVGFHGDAWLEAGLTTDSGTITAALERLPQRMSEGTRLDLALDEARDVLVDRPQSRAAVVVLLTDGLPNLVPPAEDGRPETTILRAAERLKSLTTAVFTVGLGQPSEIDADLLRAVASSPDAYREALDAAALRAIFAVIAGDLTCPVVGEWP